MPAHSPNPDAGRQQPWLAWLGLWCAVALAYANAMAGVFQFDDYNVIVAADAVHQWSAWWAEQGQGIRPLLKLSYLLNWQSDWGAPGFHAFNILVHAANAMLVMALSRNWLEQHGMAHLARRAAWWTALLFALHPAQTEAVTYVSGRSASLMALLYLGALVLHARWDAQSPSGVRQAAVAGLFLSALAVKETAVTLPLALLLWDVSCGVHWRTALRRAWPVWAVVACAACFVVWNPAYRSTALRSLEFNTLAGNVATQCAALVYLARQWLLPLWLNIDPDLPVLRNLAAALPWTAFFLAVAALAAFTRRSRSWIAFALIWCLLHAMALYLVLPRLDVANDRQLYLPLWPLCMVLVLEMLLRLQARAAGVALGTLAALYMALTVARNEDYRSEIALWEQTVVLSPAKSRVYNNLGYAYQEAGQLAQARQAYRRALQLDAGNTQAYFNLRRLQSGSAATPP